MSTALFASAFVLAGITFVPHMPTGSEIVVRASQTVNSCHQRCAPLLKSVKPAAEARRVYTNCRNLCDPPKKQKEQSPKPEPKPKPHPRGKEICVWNGTAPACNGRCSGAGLYIKDISKTGNGSRCFTGYKVLCCQRVAL